MRPEIKQAISGKPRGSRGTLRASEKPLGIRTSQIRTAPDLRALSILKNYLQPRLWHGAVRRDGSNMPLRALDIGGIEASFYQGRSHAFAAANDVVGKD